MHPLAMNESIKRSFFRHAAMHWAFPLHVCMHACEGAEKAGDLLVGGRTARSVRANYVKGLD